jgi:translation initiation factor IF-3
MNSRSVLHISSRVCSRGGGCRSTSQTILPCFLNDANTNSSSATLRFCGRAVRPAVAVPSSVCENRRTLASSSSPSPSWRRGNNNNNNNNVAKKQDPSDSGSSSGKGGKSGNLVNEALVARLIQTSTTATTADSLMVRLVVDEGPDHPSTVQVVSLSEAIRVSLDRMTDLVGVSLDSSPPVIRAAELAKLEYKHTQAKRRQQSLAASNRKEKKTFRFKAGIGRADLERKIAQLMGYLQRGHECEYTVFTRARTMRENEDAGIQLVERIQSLIGEGGTMKREPETNETKTFYRVVMEPKKGSKTALDD